MCIFDSIHAMRETTEDNRGPAEYKKVQMRTSAKRTLQKLLMRPWMLGLKKILMRRGERQKRRTSVVVHGVADSEDQKAQKIIDDT